MKRVAKDLQANLTIDVPGRHPDQRALNPEDVETATIPHKKEPKPVVISVVDSEKDVNEEIIDTLKNKKGGLQALWTNEARKLVPDSESSTFIQLKQFSITTWIVLAVFLVEDLLRVSSFTYVSAAMPFFVLGYLTYHGEKKRARVLARIMRLTHDSDKLCFKLLNKRCMLVNLEMCAWLLSLD